MLVDIQTSNTRSAAVRAFLLCPSHSSSLQFPSFLLMVYFSSHLMFSCFFSFLLIFSFSQFSHWSLPLFFLSSDALLLCCPFPFSHLPFNPFPLTFALFSSLILLNLALHSMQPLSFPYTICFFLLLPFFLSSSPLINTFDFHISSITSGGEMDRIILMCVCAFLRGHGCN